MSDVRKITRYAAGKAVMLSLLVVSLALAALIVRSKSSLAFSEPIILPGAEFSVRIPYGHGWQSKKTYNYSENTFTLTSYFKNTYDKSTNLLNCRYRLAVTDRPLQEIFEGKASGFDGIIVKTGQLQTDSSRDIDWAQITNQQQDLNLLFATINLAYNRRLDIELLSTSEMETAMDILTAVTRTIKFKDNNLLDAAAAIITEIKNNGISSFLDNRNKQAFFIISNAARQPIGFTTDVLTNEQQSGPLNIRAGSHLYLKKRYEQRTFFQCDDNFNQFHWKSQTKSIASNLTNEVVLENGLVTIRDAGGMEKNQYHPGPTAIPDTLFDFFLAQIIKTEHKIALVDVISPEGDILPVLVSKTRLPKRKTDKDKDGKKYSYIIKLDILNRQDSSQIIYFDEYKRPVKRVLLDRGWTFELVDKEQILKIFPEQAGYITKQDMLLKQD